MVADLDLRPRDVGLPLASAPVGAKHRLSQLDQPCTGEEPTIEHGQRQSSDGVELENRPGKLLGPFGRNGLPGAGRLEES